MSLNKVCSCLMLNFDCESLTSLPMAAATCSGVRPESDLESIDAPAVSTKYLYVEEESANLSCITIFWQMPYFATSA